MEALMRDDKMTLFDYRPWIVALAALIAPTAGSTGQAWADCHCQQRHCVSCCRHPSCDPCQQRPYLQPGQTVPPGQGQPPMSPLATDEDGSALPATDSPAMPSPATSFASATQLAAASEAVGFRDSTIGDFFGSSSLISGPTYGISDRTQGFNVPISGSDRRFKLTENISPIPVDRWFVNYNHFSQPVTNMNGEGIDIDRVTLGLEKTFLDQAASLEFRMPLVGGLSARQDTQGSGDQTTIEFGNITLTLKGVFWQWGDRTAVTSGLGINLPTARDGEVHNAGDPLVVVDNRAVHLLPFIALYHRPSPRTFIIGVAQLDFDTNGNAFRYREDGMWVSSYYQEQNLLYLDLSMGHWFYEDYTQSRLIRRIAAIGELHYTTTMNDTDIVQAGPSSGDVATNPFNRIDVLNGTAGLRFQLGRNYMLTTAAVFPLKDEENKLFDSEVAILVTRRF